MQFASLKKTTASLRTAQTAVCMYYCILWLFTFSAKFLAFNSSLNPAVTRANTQPSDHFRVFSYLKLSPNLPPPPQSYTFRRLKFD